MRDDQAVFDTVYTHLMRQGEPAFDEDGDPWYLAPDGRRCAIGVLIDEEIYHPAIEGVDAVSEGVLAAVTASGWEVDRYLLLELQVIHDETPPGDWREHLMEIAMRRGLSIPRLDGAP